MPLQTGRFPVRGAAAVVAAPDAGSHWRNNADVVASGAAAAWQARLDV